MGGGSLSACAGCEEGTAVWLPAGAPAESRCFLPGSLNGWGRRQVCEWLKKSGNQKNRVPETKTGEKVHQCIENKPLIIVAFSKMYTFYLFLARFIKSTRRFC